MTLTGAVKLFSCLIAICRDNRENAVVKCVEVKETHRCYRQDIADTLVSFCNTCYVFFKIFAMYLIAVYAAT